MNSDASSENPYQSPQVETLSDGELLRRFSAERDPAAFESLVARYGPLVWSVCRRTLHNREDAEDAFQATFLILLNHADSIRQRKSLGSWLFGVARRVAKKSLRAEYRRLQFLHRLVSQRAVVAAEPAPAADDVRKLLALEIAELPEMQRTVIEKCALAGESYRQVAGEMRIPVATVASHLRRGRKRLRARLLARGIGAAGLAGMITTLPCAAAAPSEILYKATAENAAAFLAEGQGALPIRIVSLMKGVAIKMPVTAKCLLAVWLSLGTGASTWWAVHGTKDREIDSGVQVAVDADPARVLDVDAPDAALEFKTVPYFIRSQSKLQLLGREPVQRDLGLNKEQIETLGKIMRPGGRVSMTELDKQLARMPRR
jgi:RNA polymerase sigma factor (sigma-70 family)